MITLPMPVPFHGGRFAEQLAAAGLTLGWVATMDGSLQFDAGEELRPRISALLAAHDGTPTAPPLSDADRIAQLEEQVRTLTQAASTPTTTTPPSPPAAPALHATGKTKT